MIAGHVSPLLSDLPAVVLFAWEIAWKAALLCMAAGLMHLLAGRRRVLLRSAVWHVCLAGLVLLPVVVACGPRLSVAVLASEAHSAALTMPSAVVERGEPVADTEVPGVVQESEMMADLPAVDSPLTACNIDCGARAPESKTIAAAPTPVSSPRSMAAMVAMAIYLLIVAILLVRLAASLKSVAALRRSGVAVAKGAWISSVEHWRAVLGLPSIVTLRESPDVNVPIVIGWRHPAILLPAELAQATDRQVIDAVLLHELTHVRRGDFAWNLLLHVVQAVYWPHPLVWLVGRMIRHVREEACDAVCVHWIGDGRAYCGILVDVAARLTERSEVALGMAMSHSSRLSRRLARIESSPGSSHGLLRRRARIGIAFVFAGVAAVVGALHFVPRASATDDGQSHSRGAGEPSVTDRKSETSSPANSAVTLANETPVDDRRANPPSGKKRIRIAGTKKRTNFWIDPESGNEYFVTVQESNNDQPQRIATVKVKRGKIEKTVMQRVSLDAYGQVSVRFRSAGIISKAPVEVGDQVKAGEVLAELDVPDIEAEIADKDAALAQAQAAEEQAQASVEAAEASLAAHEANLLAARAEHEKTASNEKFRKIQYERMKKLFEAKSIDAGILDEKEEQYETAVAASKSADAKIQTATAELLKGKVDVRLAKAAVKAAALETAAAKADLGRRRFMTTNAFRLIRSPIDGVVLEKNVEEEMGVKPGDAKPLFRLAATGFVTAVVRLAERDAVQIKRGNPATVEIDAIPNHKPVAGKVTRVAYATDPGTNVYRAEITIPNAEGRLKPGLTGAARIVVGEIEDALSVPNVSFWRFPLNEDGTIDTDCYRVVDGKIRLVDVRLGYVGPNEDNRWGVAEILDGLKEGDEVILNAPRGLQDGQALDWIPPEKK